MKKLLKTKVFIGTFLTVYFLFFAWIWFVPTPQTGDVFVAGLTQYGFPFVHYYTGCYSFGYYWAGFFGNAIFALIFSFVIGLIVSFVWQKMPAE